MNANKQITAALAAVTAKYKNKGLTVLPSRTKEQRDADSEKKHVEIIVKRQRQRVAIQPDSEQADQAELIRQCGRLD